jgi:hypothetical protein
VYDEINGRIRGHQKFYLSEASKQVVLLWRAALISMSVRGRQTARLMSSVKPSRVVSDFQIVFDGCPMGAWAVVVNIKMPGIILAWWSERFPWVSKNSRYKTSEFQNNGELVGFILPLVWLAKYYPGSAISVEGDSVTVLNWLSGESYRTGFARRAAVVALKLIELGRVVISETHHIPAEENELCDKLSRDKIPDWLDRELRISGGEVVKLVDPSLDIVNFDEFIRVLDEIELLIL